MRQVVVQVLGGTAVKQGYKKAPPLGNLLIIEISKKKHEIYHFSEDLRSDVEKSVQASVSLSAQWTGE